MDPETTWEDICNSIASQDDDDFAKDRILDLIEWLRRGGSLPKAFRTRRAALGMLFRLYADIVCHERRQEREAS